MICNPNIISLVQTLKLRQLQFTSDVNKKQTITGRSLLSWVLEGRRTHQFYLLLSIVVMVALRVLPLEIQKRIVNEVLELKDFQLLFLYCLVFFLAIISASCLKFLINYLQTLIGQQALVRIRKELYGHILTLPLNFFRKTSSGAINSSLVV